MHSPHSNKNTHELVEQGTKGRCTHPSLCRFCAPDQELLCFGLLEHVVSAGGMGELLFWDRRTRAQAAKLDDTHMEEVTQAGTKSF
jgi:hypothetical protein